MKVFDIDDCIRRYRAGESLQGIGRTLGVKGDTLRVRFVKRGVPLRSKADATRLARIVPIPNLNELIRRYISGDSMLQLAKEIGISRAALIDRFKASGVGIRNQSVALKARWRRITDPDKRRRQVEAAHKAVRGRKAGIGELIRRADARMKALSHAGANEKELLAEFCLRGILAVHQYVIGKYTTDVGIESLRVAVELHSGSWPSGNYSGELFRRTKDILDSGWNLLYVLNGPKGFSASLVADRILAFADTCSRDKTGVRQYGVISGNANYRPRGTRKLDGLPRIACPE